MKPEDLLYTPTHEWAHLQSDPSGTKTATVGISAFALEALTDLVFLQLPSVGEHVRFGERFGEVESVKAVSDLYSPVDGDVVEVHSEAAEDLERLAKEPYEFGWLVKVRLSDETSLAKLLSYQAYQRQIEEETREE
jgi:glycine cleavage system H protein